MQLVNALVYRKDQRGLYFRDKDGWMPVQVTTRLHHHFGTNRFDSLCLDFFARKRNNVFKWRLKKMEDHRISMSCSGSLVFAFSLSPCMKYLLFSQHFPALPVIPVHRESGGQSWCMRGWEGAAPARRGVRRWKPDRHRRLSQYVNFRAKNPNSLIDAPIKHYSGKYQTHRYAQIKCAEL